MIAPQAIFGRSFKGTSKCFYYKVFRIELRSECVNTKNLEFFHGMFLHSMKKFQIFSINTFTSQFYAKNFIIKTLRSALKRPPKYSLWRNHLMTNLNFHNGYGCFDTIFIYAGNTFLSSIVLC